MWGEGGGGGFGGASTNKKNATSFIAPQYHYNENWYK